MTEEMKQLIKEKAGLSEQFLGKKNKTKKEESYPLHSERWKIANLQKNVKS